MRDGKENGAFLRRGRARSLILGVFAAAMAAMTPNWTETAIANGETRTLHLVHAHTQETIDATYLVNGRYDQAVLQQLNWFLRDWRRDEPTNMDPRLFDVIWQAYNEAGVGEQVVKVMSAYRSPETNAMLRSRSRAVAKYSQHMLGKAMDTSMPGLPMSRIREVGMRMQRGGVGYYPTAGTPFVHLDVGSVRAWPRMSYDQLARIFPDGKTVHIPAGGQPMARYEEAKAEIEARNNGAIVMAPKRGFGGLLGFLFGGGGEDEAEDAAPPTQSDNKKWAKLAPRMGRDAKRVASAEADEEGGAEAPLPATAKRINVQQARALSDLPRGETAMSAPEAAAPPPPVPAASVEPTRVRYAAPEPQPERTASVEPAATEKPTPIDAARDEEPKPAAATHARRNRPHDDQQDSAATDDADAPKAKPTAPHRPSSLASVAPMSSALVSAPIPPSRPKDLAVHGDSKSAATLFDTTGSIDPKTRGKKHGKGADALAYAPSQSDAKGGKTQAAPTPPSRPASLSASTPARESKGLAPARLDKGNFISMTGASSVMDKSVSDLRAAAQKKAKGADQDDDK